MKSSLPKVLHRAGGVSLLDHVLRTAQAVAPATVTVVTGHAGKAVRDHLAIYQNVMTAVQDPQLGTAHALQQAEPFLAGKKGTVVLLSGDVLCYLRGRSLIWLNGIMMPVQLPPS